MSRKSISDDIRISKALSWILRHGAVKEKIPISSEGFVDVQQILNSRSLHGKCDLNDILRIVENNDKKRFSLRKTPNGTLQIKAVQGHSLKVVDSLDLIPITKAKEGDNVIHGTYYRFWDNIKLRGLSRMNRNHIHFAPGIPKDGNVISGMRNTCQLYIYIDLNSAIAAGLKFYKSSNEVILCTGDVNGFVSIKYFLKVVDAATVSGYSSTTKNTTIIDEFSKFGKIIQHKFYIEEKLAILHYDYNDLSRNLKETKIALDGHELNVIIQIKCKLCFMVFGTDEDLENHFVSTAHKKRIVAMTKGGIGSAKTTVVASGFMPFHKQEEILNSFSKFGQIVDYFFNESSTLCTVNFGKEEIAQKVLQSKVILYDNRQLTVRAQRRCDLCDYVFDDEHSFKNHNDGALHLRKVAEMKNSKNANNTCSVYVTGFSSLTSQDRIITEFTKFGPIVQYNFNVAHTYAIIQYKDVETTNKVLHSKVKLDGCSLTMKAHITCLVCNIILDSESNFQSHIQGGKHKRKMEILAKESVAKMKTRCSVFVKGFSSFDQDAVYKEMSKFGKIVDHFFNMEKTFGIFQFDNEDIAKKVIASSIQINKRTLTIRPKLSKEGTLARTSTDQSSQATQEIKDILTRYSAESLDKQMEMMMDELQLPIHKMHQKYTRLCNDLQTCLSVRFPGCRAHPFGSTVTGLAFKNSDLDIYIEIRSTPYNMQRQNQYSPSESVKISKNILHRSKIFKQICAIPKAKTPIVKCVHAPTGVSCDFNFKSMLGVCNSRLIKFFFLSNKSIFGAMIIIKYWARKYEISGNGKFTNYALTMLYIFYLQHCEEKYLPNIYSLQLSDQFAFYEDGWNGGFCPNRELLPVINMEPELLIPKLLIGFFQFYSTFDYGLYVISPLLGQAIPKTFFLCLEQLPTELHAYKMRVGNNCEEIIKLNTAICVQDPFVLTHNITGYITQRFLKDFQTLCANSAATLLPFQNTPNKILLKLLYEIETPQHSIADICTDEKCLFKIPFNSDMIFAKIESDIENKTNVLCNIWFDKLHQFLLSILTKVFLFTVAAKKENSVKKAMKIEGQSDVHDNDIINTTSFHCTGNTNVWEGRKNISKSFDKIRKSEPLTIIDKEIMVTDYICNVLYKGLKLDPIVDFDLTFISKTKPVEARFEFVNVNSKSSYFKIMSSTLAYFIPIWFEKYLKETNYLEMHKINAESKVEVKEESKSLPSSSGNTGNKFLESIEKVSSQFGPVVVKQELVDD